MPQTLLPTFAKHLTKEVLEHFSLTEMMRLTFGQSTSPLHEQIDVKMLLIKRLENVQLLTSALITSPHYILYRRTISSLNYFVQLQRKPVRPVVYFVHGS